MDVGVDKDGDAGGFQAREMAGGGEEAARAVRRACRMADSVGRGGLVVNLGVDLDCHAAVDYEVDQLVNQSAVPWLLFDARLPGGRVHADFVEMPDEVKAASEHHTAALAVKCIDDITYVLVENLLHIAAEAFRRTIYVYKPPILRRDKMDRPNPVVKRQLTEIGGRRAPGVVDIVDFHPRIETAGRAMLAPYTRHLGKVAWHVGFQHIARGMESQGRVGREAVVGKAPGDSLAGKRLHLGAAVAKFGMGMKAVAGRPAEFLYKIHDTNRLN